MTDRWIAWLLELAETVLGLSLKAHELGSAQVAARAFVVFFVLLAIVRAGKKRFLGEASAFDAVLVIVLGSVASRAISGTAPFGASLAGVATLVATHWIVSWLTRDSPRLSRLVKGRDDLIVRDGKVQHAALRAAHMSADDLAEDLRQQGVENPADIKSARLERSGTVSVIRKK